jgi:hypothetical protein
VAIAIYHEMKTKYILLALFLILFHLGCQKDETNDQIIGKWNWVKTINPWTSSVSNPQTTGLTQALEFFTNDIIKEYRNDTLLTTSSFKIETSPAGQSRLISSVITSNFTVNKDSLIFNEAYVDGPVISYSRTGN